MTIELLNNSKDDGGGSEWTVRKPLESMREMANRVLKGVVSRGIMEHSFTHTPLAQVFPEETPMARLAVAFFCYFCRNRDDQDALDEWDSFTNSHLAAVFFPETSMMTQSRMSGVAPVPGQKSKHFQE